MILSHPPRLHVNIDTIQLFCMKQACVQQAERRNNDNTSLRASRLINIYYAPSMHGYVS